jgi:hypothetical protein
MKKVFSIVFVLWFLVSVTGCQTASEQANQKADAAMYKPIAYPNAMLPGPKLVVLPGQIKSSNATFTQKFTSNNIADFAEMELAKANFGVLERGDLGPLLNEVNLAVNMGDPDALTKFKRGKFKATKWFVKFDILKAEPVAQAQQGFSGRPAGSILGAVIPGVGGAVAGTAVSSVQTSEAAGVWIIGLRYKIIDASTTEQVSSNYFEQKMELGAKSTSAMGVSQSEQGGLTLDTMVQRLVQQAVMDIDAKK